MDERLENRLCPVCDRPMHRWVKVRTFKAPRDPEVSVTLWLHDDDNTLRCEPRWGDRCQEFSDTM